MGSPPFAIELLHYNTKGPVLTTADNTAKIECMKRNSILWGLVLALIAICGFSLYLWLGQGEGTVAVVSVDGEQIERIDLSKVRESYDLEISNEYGTNIIHVEPGAISVTQADCPDQICVFQGKLTGSGIPIICMPHRLVIAIEGGDIDG